MQGGYGIANHAFGICEASGRWEVMAFINNAFDQHYYQNIANSFSTYNSQLAIQSYLPRDFERYAGIRATYKFD